MYSVNYLSEISKYFKSYNDYYTRHKIFVFLSLEILIFIKEI